MSKFMYIEVLSLIPIKSNSWVGTFYYDLTHNENYRFLLLHIHLDIIHVILYLQIKTLELHVKTKVLPNFGSIWRNIGPYNAFDGM